MKHCICKRVSGNIFVYLFPQWSVDSQDVRYIIAFSNMLMNIYTLCHELSNDVNTSYVF